MSSNNSTARRRFFLESLGLILIALSPFLYKLHDYIPEDPEATINLFGFVLDKNGFDDVSTYVWFLLSKLIPLYLFIIWFFTCKHWWYHIILIPLCMYAFQIFEVVYYYSDSVDTENVLWLLPICMVVIPFVYFIRIKLYDKYVHGIDLEAMEAELQAFKEKNNKSILPRSLDAQQDVPETEVDLSENVSKRTLSKLFREFRLSLKNLFNFM
ncbi:hypothetical protein SAMN06265375_104204 [Muriicola jejuensis]|uniref:Uncharacterized protein n=2 Tax=Muriicola jejuensis TaxID=504488 RepID=A0A6P0UD84_9FLAO|nr:hypothetical protein [Muriicola jejuensis]SMP24286.1 hypothetical protein SAMN06265375_104204 [Muriicola jejuensis]